MLSTYLKGSKLSELVPPVIIIGATVSITSGGTLASVTHEPGDFIIFINGNYKGAFTGGPPLLTSGYTNILTSSSSYRSVRLQYKVASTSGTTSVAVADYGTLIVVRGAVSIGEKGVIWSNSIGNPVLIPSLSGLNTTNSLVIASNWFPGNTSYDISSVTSPFVVKTATLGSSTILNSYVAIDNNTLSSYTNKYILMDTSVYLNSLALEIIGA